MADDGVVTRYRGSELHCDQCLRVTVGTKAENEKLMKIIVDTWAALNDKTSG